MKIPLSRQIIRRWAGNVLAVCLGFLLVAVLLTAAEGMFRLKARFTSPPPQVSVISTQKGALSRTGILGGGLLPDGVIQCRAERRTRLIYEVSSKTDEKGRRYTPCKRQNPDANIAAFFGCSETFGLGVEDAETLPARFCARASGWESLNYGVFGYGPQQVWLQICKQGLLKEFSTRKGIVVYSFIDDHINRLVGTRAVVAGWGYDMPWLELQDNRVAWRGAFSNRSPLQYFFLRHLDRTHLVRFAQNHLPSLPAPAPPGGKALDLLVQIMVECAQATHEQAPGLTFCCLLLPKSSGPWREGLLQRLESTDVRVFDYEQLLDNASLPMEELFFDDSAELPWGHPKAPTYDRIALQLSRDTAGTNENTPRSGV